MILTIIFISLFFSAFFSGMEIAFFSSNKLKIALDRESGTRSEKIIYNFLNNQSSFITTMLIGNNIALVIYGLFMAQLLNKPLSNIIQNQVLIAFCEIVLSSILVLIIAEFIPKAIFSTLSNRMLKVFAIPAFLMYRVLTPIVYIVTSLSSFVLTILGINYSERKINFNRLDLDDYLEKHYNENQEEINPEVEILKNALDFSKIMVRDCMIPRTDIISMDVDGNMDDLKESFFKSGHSKIIIYKNSIDTILGYVHSYELFKKPTQIKDMLLPISFVPESMRVQKVLDQLLKDRRSIAVVLDEYGGTSGIICLEDIVEQLFGEIHDEHDIEDKVEKKISENKIKLSAKIKVSYLNEKYNLNLPDSSEYETLGGLILSSISKMPEKNQEIEIGNYIFLVTKVNDNFIEEVILILNHK
ncbi:MAG: hemolysin [Flavobacteriales bacterium]|nr:hemolysin [Flavobacteriales bacterium]|tara:strand:- start:42051 stop:43295 length:1245 start_codon:yes stop_codon:yes gene_type:complete